MSEETDIDREYTDVVYSILVDGERRAILRDLTANGASGTIADLVQRIHERSDSNRDDRAFRIRLHHQHLPKMAEGDIIDYDHDDGRVTLTPRGQRVEMVRKQTAELLKIE